MNSPLFSLNFNNHECLGSAIILTNAFWTYPLQSPTTPKYPNQTQPSCWEPESDTMDVIVFLQQQQNPGPRIAGAAEK